LIGSADQLNNQVDDRPEQGWIVDKLFHFHDVENVGDARNQRLRETAVEFITLTQETFQS
jgi:hypothetical protein